MHSGNGMVLRINEVATRDGFQMERNFVQTNDKVALIDELSRLGYAKIEVTSFTSAQAIPALRDAQEVMQRITRAPQIVYTALVPNVRGGERALESRIDEFNLVMSASETHNLANLRMTRGQSFSQLRGVISLASAAKVPSNLSLSCVFGCPMENDVSPDGVMAWIDRFAEGGAKGITLCDTTGMAFPTQVQEVCGTVLQRYPTLEFTAHFHNTRAMGLVNTVAAVDAGVRQFDMSLGSIGGCPYVPGASGNVATADVVHMLELMGYRTGMNIDGLIGAAGHLERLIGHELPAELSRAEPRAKRHAPPADFADIRERAWARERTTARPDTRT